MTKEATRQDNARLVRWLTCLMFFTFAMTTDAVGSVIPRIIAEYSLSMTAAGSSSTRPCWESPPVRCCWAFLQTGIGRQLTIILGLALYGASSLLMAVFGQFPMLVALLAAAGLGISVFKTAALALIGDVTTSSQAHTRFMNTVEGFFARGCHCRTGDRDGADRRRCVLEVAVCHRGRDLPGTGGHGQRRARSGSARNSGACQRRADAGRDARSAGAGFLAAGGAVCCRGSRHLRVDAHLPGWLPGAHTLAAGLGADPVLRAARCRSFSRRMAAGPCALDHRAGRAGLA